MTNSAFNRIFSFNLTAMQAQTGGDVSFAIDGRRVTAKIPAGIKNGQKLRLKGLGNYLPSTGQRGDLYLTLNVLDSGGNQVSSNTTNAPFLDTHSTDIMPRTVDLSHLLERLESTELKLGVDLSSLSATLDEDRLEVCGEAIFHDLPSRNSSISVNVVVYDNQSRVVKKESEWIGSKDVPYDAFSLSIYSVTSDVSRIRIYVTER